MTCELCGRELHAEAQGFLCPGCTRGTDERLAALPGLYDKLAPHLAPSGSRDREPAVSASRQAPLPVDERVLTLRGPGGIVWIVESWRSALHADLDWTEPKTTGSFEDRLKAAVKGLRDNILWIAASWPAAGAFAEEIRDLHGDVQSIVDPPERTVRLGYCTHTVDGVRCGAVLRATPGVDEVRCRWCQTPYPSSTWLQLLAAQKELEEAS